MVGYPLLRHVLGQVVDEGVVTVREVNACLSRVERRAPDHDAAPWFVRLLVGGAAWIAALLLMGFFALAGLVPSGALAPLGAVVAVLAILLRRQLARISGPSTSAHDFGYQLALVGTLLARLLVGVGVADVTNSSQVAAVALLVLEAAFFVFYPDYLQRFLVPIASGAWLMLLVIDQPVPGAREVVVVVAAAVTGAFWLRQADILRGPFKDWHAPVGYGLVVFVLGALLGGTLLADDLNDGERAIWVAAIGLALLAAALLVRVLADHGVPAASTIGIVGTVLIVAFAAATWREPGLLASAILVVLGFRCRSRPMLVLAILALAAFLVVFYYQLELDLLRKSGVLVGSGTVLLVAWSALRFRGHREALEGVEE